MNQNIIQRKQSSVQCTIDRTYLLSVTRLLLYGNGDGIGTEGEGEGEGEKEGGRE